MSLSPAAAWAWLVIVATTNQLPESPEGNVFPTRDDLDDGLARAGLEVADVVDAASLPDADVAWHERADRVVATVGRDHGQERAWQQAEHQQAIMARLLQPEDAERGIPVTVTHARVMQDGSAELVSSDSLDGVEGAVHEVVLGLGAHRWLPVSGAARCRAARSGERRRHL